MNVSIRDLEKYLAVRYQGKANEQGLFMKLVEELGEVAEVLNKRSGRKFNDEDDSLIHLGEELVDMIHYIVAIAAINEIDLNEMILSKDKRASIKYGHSINLEEFIKNQE
ncbi:MAG: nucleotide pyrophosphohydrolase [Erysipelotrichaceae bacterium]|nr:nucleotide pyrophosphohydrolase [Erysipelotrichaceae bacterium]MBR3694580.1 nucleotide pyrophosphohydrolase [Erysipelotrichales bacterium]